MEFVKKALKFLKNILKLKMFQNSWNSLYTFLQPNESIMKMYQERMTENTVFSVPPEIVNSVSLQSLLKTMLTKSFVKLVNRIECIFSYLNTFLFIYFFIELFIM